MKPTSEQQQIIDHISTTDDLVLVDSIAGSGKTSLLVAISKAIPHKNGLYLAYNAAIAAEASRKFPKSTHCITTHALAYRAVVKQHKLFVGSFSTRDIKTPMAYDDKLLIVDYLREFCLSSFTSFPLFAKDRELPPIITTQIASYLDKMQTGKIEVTHEFYLKYFHILLANGTVNYNDFDFIMLDEAGDLNEVTLAIFKLLPSKKKIAVGDKHQNIYRFNHTINCFTVLANEGTHFKMTQSFRVASSIAKAIESFGQRYFSPSFEFKGVNLPDSTINTRADITRTNAALIHHMIQLNEMSTPYSLVRRASEIFKLPLMLCAIKYQGFISDPGYKHLQTDIDLWHESDDLKKTHSTVYGYFLYLYEEDLQLTQACRLILRYGKGQIFEAYTEAAKHEKTSQPLTLATAHSCKGLEFDEVVIASDLNDSIAKISTRLQSSTSSLLSDTEIESLNLYYVACTRAAKALYGASYIKGHS